MSNRKMADKHEWTDEDGDRYRARKYHRVDQWWDREEIWVTASSSHASNELLRVVYERDRALKELADLRGVSIDSILESYREEEQ